MTETTAGRRLRRGLNVLGIFFILRFLWEPLCVRFYTWDDILSFSGLRFIAIPLFCFTLAWIVRRVDALTAGISQPEQDAPQKEQDSPQE